MNKVNNWNQLARETGYNARQLAKACSLSVRQLQRNFQNRLSRSPQNWLNERRLEDARSLLLTGLPVKVVALDLGYKQASHFCRQFKLYHRQTPSEFVRSNAGDDVSQIDNSCRYRTIAAD